MRAASTLIEARLQSLLSTVGSKTTKDNQRCIGNHGSTGSISYLLKSMMTVRCSQRHISISEDRLRLCNLMARLTSMSSAKGEEAHEFSRCICMTLTKQESPILSVWNSSTLATKEMVGPRCT